MTYNVSSGKLNPTIQYIYLRLVTPDRHQRLCIYGLHSALQMLLLLLLLFFFLNFFIPQVVKIPGVKN